MRRLSHPPSYYAKEHQNAYLRMEDYDALPREIRDRLKETGYCAPVQFLACNVDEQHWWIDQWEREDGATNSRK